MERSFVVEKESKYAKAFDEYIKGSEQQREIINKFFNKKGIESNEFIVSGDGFINIPFGEDSKSDIALYINPTENDLIKFGKLLKKPNKNHGLCGFKKNSNITKEFAQSCIDNKVVINLYKPRVSDYFISILYRGCNLQQFQHNDNMYLKISSDYLKEDDTPEGFKEIKLSEYYKIKEEYEENKTK